MEAICSSETSAYWPNYPEDMTLHSYSEKLESHITDNLTDLLVEE
jgi:hypothetical protein